MAAYPTVADRFRSGHRSWRGGCHGGADTWAGRALTDHLGALCELHDRSMSGTHRGPSPDWETAMATVESLTGLRLDADWFRRPQLLAKVDSR